MKNRRMPSFPTPVLAEDLDDGTRRSRHQELTWIRHPSEPRSEPRPPSRAQK